eukprot:g1902.t1
MADTHGSPPEGLECMATMEDITEEEQNYVEFQTSPSMKWHPALYCESVVAQLLKTQFGAYVEGVQKADCEAELNRRLGAGPPIWLADKHALPVPEGDTHICQLWYQSDGKERSAKLEGAVEGEAHQALWDDLKLVLVGTKHDKGAGGGTEVSAGAGADAGAGSKA